jgi:uncharacterized protein YgbK (DUF1537 family)
MIGSECVAKRVVVNRHRIARQLVCRGIWENASTDCRSGSSLLNSTSMKPEEQADDTSIPFMDEKHLRDFLEGRTSHPGAVVFPDHLQQAVAEVNRRLARQQHKFLSAQNILLAAQNRMLESQEAVANSLKWATWVLSFATIVLAGATIVLVTKT